MSSSLVGHDPVPPSDNSNPRSILHFRGDDLLEDYGEGASTSALYGEKLQEAIDAMQAGDRLQCAGGGEAASDTLSISCSDCSLDFNGLRVVPITSQWNYLVQVPGEANKISGLVVDAKNIQSTVGTHYPIGLRVTVHQMFLMDVRFTTSSKVPRQLGLMRRPVAKDLISGESTPR